ncbi:MAG: amidohydrolase [Planctomycetaceae bacterium]|nr:amidohydrolase [Planctomycetaceae bacterium]
MLPRPATAAEPADLVLRGGKVVTMDPDRPLAEAVAVAGDRIVAVGTAAEIAPQIGPQTKVLDLAGKFVMPGFIEGHGHFLSLGEQKLKLDLTDATSWEEVVAAVAKAVEKSPRGRWIEGRGWHQAKWKKVPEPNVEGYPVVDALSLVSPDNPVVLTHGTGHMCLANAKAMELAGVTAATKPPAGGEILHDSKGQPTGVFRESAMGLIHRALNRAHRERSADEVHMERLKAIRLATEECLKHGVTSFQDAGSSIADVDLFNTLADRGELKVRLWIMLNEGNDALAGNLARYRMIGHGNGHLTVRGIKRMIDGALGTHGAWLLAPYDDLPSSTGLNLQPLAELRKAAELAIQHDYQLCVHAIGDRANREVLDLMEEVFRQHPQKQDLRWRIEHAQHIHPDDIPRFARLGVIASMQANHATSDGPFVVRRLGQRRAAEGAYAWRRLLDAKAVVINGTDVPVERIDPIACFYSSVTRKMADGVAFFPEQAMTREEALRSYTAAAAWTAFEEREKGTLARGKLADLVVLSGDLLTVPADEFPKVRVEMTIVGGRVIYEAPVALRKQ